MQGISASIKAGLALGSVATVAGGVAGFRALPSGEDRGVDRLVAGAGGGAAALAGFGAISMAASGTARTLEGAGLLRNVARSTATVVAAGALPPMAAGGLLALTLGPAAAVGLLISASDR